MLLKKAKPIVCWLIALFAIAIILLHLESDLLWKVQRYNLFLYSQLFFKQQMTVSGGMLSYLGAFFTQFLYHPWLGVTMLCGWWLLLMWLVMRTFSVPDRCSIVALIPVAILLTANMDMGYWVYAIKLHGWFFSATIGTTVGVAMLWAFRKLPSHLWLRMGFVVFVSVAGYPLMGVYALATALLMGIWTWRLTNNRQQNIILSATALLTIVVIPLYYYRFVYCQTNIIDIYRTAIPDFTFQEEHPSYYIPYYLLVFYFLAFAIAYRKQQPIVAKEQEMPVARQDVKNKKSTKYSSFLLYWVGQSLLIIAVGAIVWHFWYRDANFHHELRMQRCIEECDWENVMKEGRDQHEEPTRSIVMMHNLALSRLGRQCEEMYKFPKGSSRSSTSLPIYLFNTVGRLIYYNYGMMNDCYRMCIEEAVEFGWSVDLLQYLARASIMSNEPQVARKYLNLLKQTHYYGKWADRMEQLIGDRKLLEGNKETGPITRMMQYPDIPSDASGYVEANLMTMLSHIDSDDSYFQEQAVLAAMWTRNSHDFWDRFDHYVKLHPDKPVPRIIQEAACLFGHLDQLPFVDMMPFDESVRNNFMDFMYQMELCQGMPDIRLRNYLAQHYGNTYYFEYFFLRDITYY